MSDTMQVVQWALEYTCPLRSGGASKDPAGTLREIARAHEIGRSGAHPGVGFGVMGDVYVSGYTMQPVPKSVWGATGVPSDKDDSVLDFLHEMHEAEGSTVIHFPCSGFIISEAFAGVGGIDGLLSLCGKCPANAGAPHPAGCAGMMYLHPHDEELQVQLAAAVDRLGLRDRVDEFFVRTNPIWFGLWVRSPLGTGACEVLDLLVGELSKRKLDWWGAESLDDLRTFQRATRISREKKIPLHVSMAPPGHCDFGWSTTFAHCPRCKAEADLPRWKRRYPSTPYPCKVCGFEYVPSATASSERDDFDMDGSDLRKVLGEERFDAFAFGYLTGRGVPAEGARQVLDRLKAEEEAGRVRIEVENRRQEQRQKFIETVLYAGLHPTRLVGSENEGEEYFNAAEVRELVRRCKSTGANVLYMFHESKEDELCLSKRVYLSGAEALLDEWQMQGCNEWFALCIGVPDQVLDRFTDQ